MTTVGPDRCTMSNGLQMKLDNKRGCIRMISCLRHTQHKVNGRSGLAENQANLLQKSIATTKDLQKPDSYAGYGHRVGHRVRGVADGVSPQ